MIASLLEVNSINILLTYPLIERNMNLSTRASTAHTPRYFSHLANEHRVSFEMKAVHNYEILQRIACRENWSCLTHDNASSSFPISIIPDH